MYIYASHMGGFYTTVDELSYEQLYCEECGDSDWPVGEADSVEEAYNELCQHLRCTLEDELEEQKEKDEFYDPEWFESERQYALEEAEELFSER